ncbi:hypothetical protein FRB97_009323 [Tulasnella sp. 331]|nr:hypothetical protein FRB97_009323 [Tulasnella sp. 331]
MQCTGSGTAATGSSLPMPVVQSNLRQPYAALSAYPVAIIGQNSSNSGPIFSMAGPGPSATSVVMSTTSPLSQPPTTVINGATLSTPTSEALAGLTPQVKAAATSEQVQSLSPTYEVAQPLMTEPVEITQLQGSTTHSTWIEAFFQTTTPSEGLEATPTRTATDVVTKKISSPIPVLTSSPVSSSPSLSLSSTSSTSSSTLDLSTSATSASHLPFIVIGSVIGGFIFIAGVSAIVAWFLRWRARRHHDYGHDEPWSDEPIFVGGHEKSRAESSPVVYWDTGTSWGNAAVPMRIHESRRATLNRASYYDDGGGGMNGVEQKPTWTSHYRGTPYPRHNFFPPPGTPLPPAQRHARTSLYGGVVEDFEQPYPYSASPQPLPQDYPADYANKNPPTYLSPVTPPQTQNLAVTNFAPGDMSVSTTMHTRKSVPSPLQQPTPARILLDTPRNTSSCAPPSPWAPLDVPSRRGTGSSTASSTHAVERPLDISNQHLAPTVDDGVGRESWASALRTNFFSALGNLSDMVAVATTNMTPRAIDDDEKWTPAVPARVMTRRSLKEKRYRMSRRPSITRGGTSTSAPSVYEEEERHENDSDRHCSAQSSRLYNNVRRHSHEEAVHRQRQLDQHLRRADSDRSSSGWTTDRGDAAKVVGRREALTAARPSRLPNGSSSDWRRESRS